MTSSEELEVDHGAQNGELHHNDDSQQQLVGDQPANREPWSVTLLELAAMLTGSDAKNRTSTYRRDMERRIFLLRLRFSPVLTNYGMKRKSIRK